MAKYIDAEKLKNRLKCMRKQYEDTADYAEKTGQDECFAGNVISANLCSCILADIDSLQQEQTSFSSNLDEAAEKFARLYDNGTCDGIAQDCFKAGAEWMAGQMKQEQPPRGYDETYLNECIAKASKTWKGVDVDKFIDEVRGRETMDLEEEVKKYFQGLWPGTETAEQCNTDMHFTPLAILRMVKYFYELGLKTEEENK